MCSRDLSAPLEGDGWTVVLHKTLFAGETADHEWIPQVAERGHIIITSDKKMRTWGAEDGLVRPTIERVKAKVFFLRGVGLTPQQQAEAVIAARKSICRHAKRCAETFIVARIHSAGSRLGEVQVLHIGGATKTERKYGKDALSQMDSAAE